MLERDGGTGDPTARTLRLLSLLSTGRAFTGAELAARLDVSPRTVRRDAERLRDLGYVVTSRPGPGGSYRLAAGSAMPPLLLSDDEAVTVMAALTLATPRLPPGTPRPGRWSSSARSCPPGSAPAPTRPAASPRSSPAGPRRWTPW